MNQNAYNANWVTFLWMTKLAVLLKTISVWKVHQFRIVQDAKISIFCGIMVITISVSFLRNICPRAVFI
jgi:hypothetical protein